MKSLLALTGILLAANSCNGLADVDALKEEATLTQPELAATTVIPIPTGLPPGPPGWTSVGCYVDPPNSRTLRGINLWYDVPMTPKACTDHCDSLGFTVAGTEYGGECYCDLGVSSGTSKAPEEDCNMACKGDANSVCGGPNRINLYVKTTSLSRRKPQPILNVDIPVGPVVDADVTITRTEIGPTATITRTTIGPAPTVTREPAPPPSTTTVVPVPTGIPAGPPGWTSVGCYVDPGNPRALRGIPLWYDVPMTPKACTDHCASLGYTIAGTEYAGECYCDNYIAPGTVKAPEAECNMACKGDSSVSCGGPSRINLYVKQTRKKRSDEAVSLIDDEIEVAVDDRPRVLATPSLDKATPVQEPDVDATTIVPVPTDIPPGPPGWTSVGCFVDPPASRTLRGINLWYDVPMTPKACTDHCDSLGFKIAGTEYGGECYCDNGVSSGTVKAPEAECSMACKGDATVSCGGPNRINLYVKQGTLKKRSLVESLELAVLPGLPALAERLALNAMIPKAATDHRDSLGFIDSDNLVSSATFEVAQSECGTACT